MRDAALALAWPRDVGVVAAVELEDVEGAVLSTLEEVVVQDERGAVEVGMLRALFEAGVQPDLVVGTSIGAINGAAVAADPSPTVVDKLVEAWASPTASAVYGDTWYRQVQRLAKSKVHLNDPAPLRQMLEEHLARQE